MQGDELGLLLRQERGQFLEFVSAYEYKKGGAKKKSLEELCREVARLLGGMCNADGGTLVIGVEPDKSVTGTPYLGEELQEIIQAPQALLTPPLYSSCEKIHLGNLLLLKFQVGAGLEVYRISGGRTFYRIATENPSLAAEQIYSIREAKRLFYYERQHVPGASWDDLDQDLVQLLLEKANHSGNPKAILQKTYHLLDGPMDKPALTMAGLLLLARDPSQWHPRCGIDFVKYQGTERQHGASLNVIKRVRFEAPLCHLIDEAVGRIKEHIRERMILHDLFFRERLEYPAFAWQEALVNAVAHRDYGITGASIEVWMFDDRIEVRSPGSPPAPVTLEQLRAQKRIHFSRNPLLVRVLADLGFLREMGEGVPRMFQEMEQHGLYPPDLANEGFFFTVTLRNTPIYDEVTLRWLNQFKPAEVNFRQRRLLAYAYAHGKVFSTADYQRVAEVDRDMAYRDIRAMVKLGIVGPHRPKSRIYRIIERL
ncbi:MAG: ATP-binding protein [Candidatus Binatia bacterium]